MSGAQRGQRGGERQSGRGRDDRRGGADKTVRLYDAATGGEIRKLPGAEGAVYSVAFAPAGNVGPSTQRDGTVRLHGTSGMPYSLRCSWLTTVSMPRMPTW